MHLTLRLSSGSYGTQKNKKENKEEEQRRRKRYMHDTDSYILEEKKGSLPYQYMNLRVSSKVWKNDIENE